MNLFGELGQRLRAAPAAGHAGDAATWASCSRCCSRATATRTGCDAIDDDDARAAGRALRRRPMLRAHGATAGARRCSTRIVYLAARCAPSGLSRRAAPAHEPRAAGRRPVPPARQRGRAAGRRAPRDARRPRAAAGGAVPARAARRLPALRRQRARAPRGSTACRSTSCSRSTSCASAAHRIEALLDCAARAAAGARAAAPDGRPGAARPRSGAASARCSRGTTRCWRARWPSAAPRPASTTSPATAPSTAPCCAPRPAAAR